MAAFSRVLTRECAKSSTREVPQTSTGFSPFELLYGHEVRGPLDVLKESWQISEKSEESVVSHILSIRNKLEKMKILADANLKEAQQKQKQWYDKNARQRSFEPDDMVLLLLPTSTSKLMAQWQGPYRVIKKVGRANYLIEMPHRRKNRQVYHINLLKKWRTPSVSCFTAEEVEEEDFPDWKGGKQTQPQVGNGLSSREKTDIAEIFK